MGKEEDVDADERDLRLDDIRVIWSYGAHDSHDHLAYEHTGGSVDEQRSSAESLDGPEGQGSRTDIDQSGNEGDEERV